MLITKENLHTSETLEWFINFQNILHLLMSHSKSIFGGVVRDYIVPCVMMMQNKKKFKSLAAIVDKYGSVQINDIDVQVNSLKSAKDIITIIKNTLNVKQVDVISDIQYARDIVQIVVHFNSCLGQPIVFRIDFVNFMSCNFAFPIDFTVNNLRWINGQGLSLIDKTKSFYNWVLAMEPRLIEQNAKYEDVDWKLPEIQKSCVDLVCLHIMDKRAHFMKQILNNSVAKTLERFNKLLAHEFIISDNDFADINCYVIGSPTHKSDDNKCAICMESFEANQVVMRTKCRHVFHIACIGRWAETKQSCPLCRQSINLK